jgi:hypothetical protein
MGKESKEIPLLVESGIRRVFASAAEWPGWCRSGRDEASGVRSLLEYRLRCGRSLETARLGFQPPADIVILNDAAKELCLAVPPRAPAGTGPLFHF